MLPFTHDQFIGVFAAYNEAVWPAQVVAYVVAAVALGAIAWQRPWSGALAAWLLASLWIWTGVVYHGMHFSTINAAARLFAAMLVLEAMMLAWWALRRRPELAFGLDLRRGAGLALAIYAAVLYPLLGLAFGLHYPAAPTFGITPCPLTLFTFGLVLLAPTAVPWRVLVVPLLWSLIGGSAAFLMRIPQDWVLLLGGVVVVAANIAAAPHGRRATAHTR